MLKYALLAGVMTFAAPAVAQVQVNTAPTQTTPAQAVPDQATSPQTPAGSPVNDPQAAPATPMDSTAQATPAGDATQSAAAQPAAGADQVASVVETEFPTYDANKDGKLEKTEFASWMVKLKQASDPKASATDAATKSWVNSAFAQADKDKSKSVSKPELVGFLSQGQS
ncbi:EF-hand domain-containing protein [Sphingomonas sp. RP10(2022)]|uniref:EF-hand domain-containing protein n=1 Tax=Sphingomonas liriopis TaxID=2949094 RepID=A0A9X2HV81_9SPHN|nr:EF-hand domain-containing protein [Sphingomonas liriopis]MCP3734224.1 EF-hand domain-containing protein [Sphingomonas liriopis]